MFINPTKNGAHMKTKLNPISALLKSRRANSAFCSAALVAMLATPTVSAQENATEDEVEVIQVSGIAGSLAAAARLKRFDGRIVDAIVAEDIGKLPDNNIAEALQRIAGVSISSDFGVGTSVSIRGLPQNRVELNGRSTLGDSRDGVSLEDFPSSFLKSVSVIKSPTADMIEGALGGTVSMETVRPLDLDKLTAAVSFDGEYADKTENFAPIFNASVGNNWDLDDAGSFGVIAMVSYQDREIRQDEFYNRVRLYDEDAGGAGAQGQGNTPSGMYAVREQNTQDQYVEVRERTAFNVSLQWAPESGEGNLYLDLSSTERDGSQAGNSILDVGGSRTYNANTTQDANGQVDNYSLTNAFTIPKTWSSFRKTQAVSHALGGDWQLTDTTKISGEVSFASSESENPTSELNLRPLNHTNWNEWAAQYDPAEWAGNQNNAYDTECRGEFACRHNTDVAMFSTGDNLPSVVYSDSQTLLSPENLAIRAFYSDDDQTDNEETAFRFDVETEENFGLDFISSLKAGVRATQNEYTFSRKRYRADNLYRQVFTDFGTSEEAPYVVWMDDFEAMFPNTFATVSHNDTFGQTGLSGQYDLDTYRTYRGDLLADAQGSFARIQQMLAGTNFATTGSLADNQVEQEGSFNNISEDTTALYLSANLDFDELSAIVGGRYIQTDLTAKYFNAGELISEEVDYNDFLPSINVSYQISDETQLRFAGAKVMRRADYNQLSPAVAISSALTTGTSGSASLEPYRATQFDLSLEHYYGEGNVASFAIFHKDVESFISSTNVCLANSQASVQQVTEWETICQLDTVGVDNTNLVFATQADFAGEADIDTAGFEATRIRRDAGLTGVNTAKSSNGENGTVQGFELSVQQNLDFLPGLGFNANYTYSDSEQPDGNVLLNISKNTFNGQVYWENDEFQVRLAYNYRSRFLSTQEETRVATIGALALNSGTNDETSAVFDPTAGNNYQDDRGQFDFSASWDINENVTLVTNINNLTGEPIKFSTELGSVWRYHEADRRMTVGVRAKF
jgi:TonB-dependent receptor